MGSWRSFYGGLTRGTGYSNRKAYYYPERDQQVMQLLEAKQPAAVITVHSKIGSPERLMRDWEFPIASASVPAEVGLILLKKAGQNAHLNLQSRQAPARFYNVAARKTSEKPERILLIAHFDTVTGSPGAIDNASGVDVLLASAARYARKELLLSLEWIALNGEEMGGLGDVEVLRRQGDQLDQTLAVINIDGIGGFTGANTLTTLGSSSAFQDLVFELGKDYPGVAWCDPWYESDHTAYLFRGVPCIALSSFGALNLHQPSDSLEWISPAKLSEGLNLVSGLIEALQDKTPAWCREQTRPPASN